MNKYNPQNLSVRSRAQIRESLLSHPDNRERREELELLIDWRLAKETHLNESGARVLRAFFVKMGGEESPSLRALTLLNEMNGGEEVFKTKTQKDILLMALFGTAADGNIIVDRERLDALRQCPVVAVLPTRNIIDFKLTDLFDTKPDAQKSDAAEAFVQKHFVGGIYKASTPRPS